MNNRDPVRLKDVAKAAHVSIATVSMALRNNPRLPTSTRERIQAVADRLGYRPNPLVSVYQQHIRSRRSKASTTLAYLIRSTPGGTVPPTEHSLGALNRANQMGYRMDVFNVDDPNLDPARLNRVLIARGIRGIVLDPSMGKQMDPPFALDWPQFAFAMIGYNLFTPFLHRAVSNHYLSMQLILQNLRQRGYRRIGLCIPRDINRNRRGMFAAAFLNDQTDQPRREQIPIHFCEISETSVAGTAHWIRQHRPDAIIALSGKELRMALTQCGLSVPQDVGIAHLHTHPSMTDCAGIDPRPTAVAAAAVDLVVGQLNRNEYGIPGIRKTVEIDPAWVDGTSLRIGASLS